MSQSASALDAGSPGQAPPAAAGRRCARCHGLVYRVPRRLADRIFSFFWSVQRYRCDAFACGWEGNLRVKSNAIRVGRYRALESSRTAPPAPRGERRDE